VRVKVVMGFVACWRDVQYLSNIDQVLQIRRAHPERILAAWFVLMACPACNLRGCCDWEGIEAGNRWASVRLSDGLVVP